jgi:two-component system, OmpR family, sensor kinase
MPIRLRLTAWYILVIAAVLAALTAFVVTRLRSDLTSELDRSLRSSAEQIRLGYRVEGRPEFRDTARTVLPESPGDRSGAQLLDATGRVLVVQGDAVTRAPLIDRSVVRRALAGQTVVLSRRLTTPREHLRIVAIPVRRHRQYQVVVAAESLHEIDDATSRAFVLLLAGSGGALGLIAVGGWWIARKALRPVEKMARRADEIGLDDFAQRIAVPDVNDELGHLARTLNAMLDRLEKGVHTRQRLVADASHELRAPLAAMRMELEVSLRHDSLPDHARAVLTSAREEVVRMSRIVDNLLTLAHVDEGHLTLLREPQDLHELAERSIRACHAAAAAGEVDVVVEGDPVLVEGDRDRLDQVIGNLLDNAIRFAPRGSRVLVSVWHEGVEAGFTVADSGPGVPDDARQRIFERFGRQDPSRGRDGGAGLGLAICSEIVRAHHGRIWVEDHIPHGSAFVVALPRSPGERSRPDLVPSSATR